jgi:hypothetical protein
MTLRTWHDYYGTCERIVEVYGVGRPVSEPRPDGFQDFWGAASENPRAGGGGE